MRRKRQLTTLVLGVVLFSIGVILGVGFEVGRYLARFETRSDGI